MTGISYTATIDDADMAAKLEALMDRMENREGFFKNVGEHLLVSVAENFENEQSPQGDPWQRLSPVTLGRRLKQYGNAPVTILRASGALAGSINYRPSNDDVRVGSGLVYAAIQHHGGDSKGYMKGAVIPARPYLGMSAEDEEAVVEIAEDWLAVE